MREYIIKIFCIALSVITVGCAFQNAPARTETTLVLESNNHNENYEYRLQVGDELEIKFFGTPEYNQIVMIRPDGKISLQLLDDVQAYGLTPMELDAAITEGYKQTFLDPNVTVILKKSGAKIFVGGEVGQPRFVPYDMRLTALQAIIEAGGFTDRSEPSNVILVRRNENSTLTTMIDLKVSASRADSNDILLLPSDILIVPTTKIADANKFVRQYIKEMLPFGVGYRSNDYFFGMGLGY